MDCLVTINVGNFISETVRKHFNSACERWHCDYSELTHPYLCNYPGSAKLFMAEKLVGYDNLLYVDGDAIIENDAPNPFDLCVEENVIYAVTDLQAGNPNDSWREWVYNKPLRTVLKSHPELIQHPEAQAFNAGVLLFKPTLLVLSMYHRIRNAFPEQWCGYQEQALENLFAYNTPELRVEFLPLKWNHMVIEQTSDTVGNYISHYGGTAKMYLAACN